MLKIEPVTLKGRVARLEPLKTEHFARLYEASQDAGIWRYLPVKRPESQAEMEQLLAEALQLQQEGTCLPFTIIDVARDCAVGQTRYLSITHKDRGIEIGWTWLTPSVQRTGINTECKYLLLSHAFEQLGVIRVQLKTHHLNVKSQQAIERLGAVKEGTLRNQIIMPDGSYRHSVYYSILDSEWPQVKAGLEAKMQFNNQQVRSS
jgi:N-acetyltransferase